MKNKNLLQIVTSILLPWALLCAMLPAFAEEPSSNTEVIPSSGLPKTVVEDSTFEFGSVAEGTVVEHEFEIKNLGTAPLVITSKHPACGCTAAVLDSDSIAPNATGILKVAFNTDGFYGNKVKTVRVNTNDPASPSFVVTLKGEVKREIAAEPARLFFGVVPKGTAASKDFSIVHSGKTAILESSAKSESITVTAIEGQKNPTYKVTLAPSLPVGLFRSAIVIKTDNKKRELITIPVFAKIMGDLEFFPSDISFGLLEGPLEETVAKSVQLKNSGSSAVQILSAESDNPSLDVTYKSGDDANSFEVTVRLAVGTIGTVKGRVTVVTNHPDPDQRSIILPVYAIVAKRDAEL